MSGKPTSLAAWLLWLLPACDFGGLESHRAQVPVRLAFSVPPSAVIAGAAIRPSVTVVVQDEKGNTVSDARTLITLELGNNPGHGSLTGTLVLAVVNGVATFPDLSLDRSGTGYTLTAMASGGLTGATSTAFDVSLTPTTLAFVVQPTTTRADHPIAPAVTVAVLDDEGNTVESASTSVTMGIASNPSGGTLSGSRTAAVINGRATFQNLVIDNPGNGYTLAASATALSGDTSVAFDVSGGLAAVDTGGLASFALTDTGAAYFWGLFEFGDPMDETKYIESHRAIPLGASLTFAAVSTGGSHSCARTISGAAHCWGMNSSGQLGSGMPAGFRNGSRMPVPVIGGLTFAVVSAGGNHSCGVTTAGAAYCWGDNSRGQLGNGSTMGSTVPVPVMGELTFTTVSAGDDFSCGVATAGTAYCWGANTSGQLGDGSTTDSPVPVQVAGGLTFTAVSAGSLTSVPPPENLRIGTSATVFEAGQTFEHACGLSSEGAAYCWGGNSSGQLGNGETTDSSTPVLVSGDLTFAMVSAGGGYSCGVTASGAAYCWGDNGTGQLGDESTTDSTVPTAVAGGLTFRAVAAGPAEGSLQSLTDETKAHTCGLTKVGVVYCWGSNEYGQLGNTSGNSSTPVRIADF